MSIAYPNLPLSKMRRGEWFLVSRHDVTKDYIRSQIKIWQRNPFGVRSVFNVVERDGVYLVVRES